MATYGTATTTTTIAAGSTLQITDGTQDFFLGTIDNLGTISLSSTGDAAIFTVDSSTVTLTGGGLISLSNNANNIIEAADSSYGTLVNVNNTIAGAGQLTGGNGTFAVSITNEAAGTIDADLGAGLVISTTTLFTNLGLLEATGGNSLLIEANPVANTGGTVLAAGAGSSVALINGATITGGTLVTTGGGVIAIAADGNAYQTIGSAAATTTIATGSTLQINDGAQSFILGTLDNLGTISLASSGDEAIFAVNSPTVTLTGGGLISLSNNASNIIEAADSSHGTLVNVNNTIAGAGQLTGGNGTFAVSITNEAAGTIDADLGAGLVISTTTLFTNLGLLEATGGNSLLIEANPIANAGGTVLAAGAGSSVALINGATITGGTLVTTDGGVIAIAADGNAYQTIGSTTATTTIAAGSTLQVDSNAQSYFLGVLDNLGTIGLAASTNQAAIFSVNSPTLTMTGGGLISLSNNANNIIEAADSSKNTLVNVNNTIAGAGQITGGNGTFAVSVTNEAAGIIDADLSAGLVISTTVPFINLGLIEATAGSPLSIVANFINNTGGTILAAGAGSDVGLTNGATIAGGTLLTTAGGLIAIAADGNAYQTIGGTATTTTIAASSTLQINSNAQAYFLGTLDNLGTLSLAATTNQAAIFAVNSATMTLAGGGLISLSNDVNNIIEAADSSTDALVNVDNTIAGAGQITGGNGTFAVSLTNEAAGIIDADLSAGLLISTTLPLANLGLIETTAAGSLTIQNNGATLANSGTILAGVNTVVINESVSGSGTLAISTGATMDVSGTIASGQTVNFGGGANELLELGTPAAMQGTIANLVAGDTIDVQGFDAGSVTPANSVLTIAGTGFQAGQTLTYQLAGNSILSFTTVADGNGGTDIIAGVNNANTLDGLPTPATVAPGTLFYYPTEYLIGTINNTGTIGVGSIASSGTLFVDSPTVTLTGGGQIVLSPTSGNLITGGGTLVNTNNTISGSGVIGGGGGFLPPMLINVGSGLIEATGAGGLTIGTSVSGSGTLAVGAGSTLDVTGAVGAGQTVTFGGSGGEVLQLGAPAAVAATLTGLATGDTIDLAGFSAASAVSLNGTLSVPGSGAQAGQGVALNLAGGDGFTYSAVADGNGGTDIVVTAPRSGSLPNVSSQFTTAVYAELLAAVDGLIPSGATPSVVSIAGGGAAGSSVPGTLNVLVVTVEGAGATQTEPGGFGAGYLLTGTGGLQDTTGGGVLVDASSGAAITGAAGDVLFGGNAGGTLFATTGAETLIGGTGTNAFFLGASTAQVTSQGNDIITGSSAAETVNASGSALYFGTSGTTTFNASGTGGDTIIGGGNGNTITGGGGSQLIFGSSSLDYIGGAGAATIIGGGNGNTVTGGSGNLLLFASSSLTYGGTGGAATVIGGGGPVNAYLGAGGGVIYGSPFGNDTLASGSGTAIMVGGGGGDLLVASGAANDTLVAGAGAETISGAGSSGNLVIFGGPGADVLAGGTGNDLFVTEPGNETLSGGGGTNSYIMINFGATSRVDVITDFDPNHDAIGLYGYGAAPTADAAALASAVTTGGNTTVSLTDGTQIVFTNAPTLHSYNFF